MLFTSVVCVVSFSPTYTSLHYTHWISYVTPSFLHLAFPDTHTGHSLCSLDLIGGGGLHSLSPKGFERCNIDLSDLPVVSTTLTLMPAPWISLWYLFLSSEPGVFGTKMTVSAPPRLNQVSLFFCLSSSRSLYDTITWGFRRFLKICISDPFRGPFIFKKGPKSQKT